LKFSLIPSVPFLFFFEIDFVVKFHLQKKLQKNLEKNGRDLQKEKALELCYFQIDANDEFVERLLS